MTEELTVSENSEHQPAVEQEKEEPAAQKNVSQNSEVAKLHRECAKYRTALNAANEEKTTLQKDFDEAKIKIENLTKQKIESEILHKLEKIGCLKPTLVLSEIPADCEDIDEFLKVYKNENQFLFRSEKSRHGFSFRGGKTSNYTTSQQMNNYIRTALGR